MSFGTDRIVSFLQYFFTSTEEHKYWYVPVAEDHSFVEAEEEVVFAFSDLTRARTVCMHYKWPGLLELGPKKWKNFNIQKYIVTWLESIKVPNSVRMKVDIDPQHFI